MTTTSEKTSRILIVDDHPMLRDALSIRISMVPGLEVCGEAEGEDEALAIAEQANPDLALVDISLKRGNGIELVKQMRAKYPKTKILVISSYPESLYGERALRAGALGYVNKQEPNESVLEAIHTVLQGERYISPETTQRLVELALGDSAPEASPIDRLSDRELEVFQLLGHGMNSQAIGEKLGISPHTVDTYREKIKCKIGARNGVELQREAVRWILKDG